MSDTLSVYVFAICQIKKKNPITIACVKPGDLLRYIISYIGTGICLSDNNNRLLVVLQINSDGMIIIQVHELVYFKLW